jgi:HK97 gp10 family phage protein
MADVRVEGLSDLAAALRSLPRGVARNVLSRALAQSARIVRGEARLRAPIGATGALRRSIYYRAAREQGGLFRRVFQVRVRRGARKQAEDQKGRSAYYAHFVEFGTVKWAGKPFMRPAWDAKRHDALEAVVSTLVTRLPGEVAKVRRR